MSVRHPSIFFLLVTPSVWLSAQVSPLLLKHTEETGSCRPPKEERRLTAANDTHCYLIRHNRGNHQTQSVTNQKAAFWFSPYISIKCQADEWDSSSSVKRHFTEDRLVSVRSQCGDKVTLNLKQIDTETLQLIFSIKTWTWTQQIQVLITDCSLHTHNTLLQTPTPSTFFDIYYTYINYNKLTILKFFFCFVVL